MHQLTFAEANVVANDMIEATLTLPPLWDEPVNGARASSFMPRPSMVTNTKTFGIHATLPYQWTTRYPQNATYIEILRRRTADQRKKNIGTHEESYDGDDHDSNVPR